ncbi:hypothetical protein ABZP36_015799 [Zizania latifolia]
MPPAPPPQPQPQPLSWAKRTGFQSRVSGESSVTFSAPNSGQVPLPRPSEAPSDLESGPAARPNSTLTPTPAANAANADQQPPPPPPARTRRRDSDGGRPNGQAAAAPLPQLLEEEDDAPERPAHVKYELRDSPGVFPIGVYGFQHYISMLGSIILIPLVMVPAMGGSPNFKHIMKHLQGAIIIGGGIQVLLGYTGLMSLFLRLINPVVVSPTVAAVGLSFFSYGFTKLGSCIEMGILQLLMVVMFALYLQKIKLFGYRVFLIYAVPLALGITWAVAFVLTATGVYGYKGCDANIPASNNVSSFCRKHVLRMKSCRVDTSHALRSSPWLRFPYPFQWGTPIFSWKMGLVMCVASVIASVDSVGSYHASSLFVATRPPTAGVVSRGIGVEGKVGAFIASIPDVLVAALLCFMWAMLCALGLSNLRYSAKGSSRNSIVVGLALFFSVSSFILPTVWDTS